MLSPIRLALALLALTLAVAACTSSDSSAPPAASPGQTATLRAFPTAEEPVALEAGTYLVDGTPPYTVTVPDGWTGDSGTDLKTNGAGISPWATDDIGIFRDACHGELGDPDPAPATAAGLVSALRAQKSGPLVSDPVATTLGGLPATRVDLDYPDRMASADCRIGTGQLQIWDGYFVFFPNNSASLYVVDVAGTSVLFLVETADGASAAVRAESQSILDSIRFKQ